MSGIEPIYKIQSTSFPECLFEYHTQSKKVYFIPLGDIVFKDGEPVHEAQMIAELVPNATCAKEFVKAWIAGYKMGYKRPSGLMSIGW